MTIKSPNPHALRNKKLKRHGKPKHRCRSNGANFYKPCDVDHGKLYFDAIARGASSDELERLLLGWRRNPTVLVGLNTIVVDDFDCEGE